MAGIELREEFKKQLLQVDNEYDLVALCYKELLTYVPRGETQFVTGFIDYLDKDPAYGPYSQNFRKLRSDLTKMAREMDSIDDNPNGEYGLSSFIKHMQDF